MNEKIVHVTTNPVLSRTNSQTESSRLNPLVHFMQSSTLTLISVEGNVCGGTRTVLENLRKQGYAVFMHDASHWDPPPDSTKVDDSLAARVCVHYAHVSRVLDAIDPKDVKTLPDGQPVVFVERWIESAEQVFLRTASQTTLSQEGVRLWTELVRLLNIAQRRVDAYVYLEMHPQTTYERLVARSPSLKDISNKYVDQVHFHYTDYIKRLTLNHHRILRLKDSNVNVNDIEKELVRLFLQ